MMYHGSFEIGRGSIKSVGHNLLLFLGSLFFVLAPQAGEARFQYYRFTPTQLRNDNAANSVQLAEFEILLNGERIPGASASNPGGSNPGSERPSEAVDGDLGTKWLDFNKGALILSFDHPVTSDGYRWATANDANARDTVRWRMEGSNDLSTWALLDDQTTSDYPTPTSRFAWLTDLDFSAVPDVPVIERFEIRLGDQLSDQGVAAQAGDSFQLLWSVRDAIQIVIDPDVGPIQGASGETTLSADTTTTYILKASNAHGTAVQSLIVLIGDDLLPIEITEFMASNSGDNPLFRDEDGDGSDWIELHNPNPVSVNLGGYHLTDDPDLLVKWSFPALANLEGGSYQVVFASGKDRRPDSGEWHTNFQLSASGEYLALVASDGETIIQAFEPTFPIQYSDKSYGKVPGDPNGYDYYADPTFEAPNTTSPGLPVVERVAFLPQSRTFTGSLAITLSTPRKEDSIRYTTDGSIPTASSILYEGRPLNLSQTTQVRARVFRAGAAPGPVSSGTWIAVDQAVEDFSSNLPIIVLDNFNGGSVTSGSTPEPGFFSLFEPDATGVTRLVGEPQNAHRMGFKRRGSSTLNDPKGNYRIEFRQEANEEDLSVNLLGLSEDPEWILFAPYRFDRSLLRIPFIHQLSLNIGEYASRSVFVEVFLSTDSGRVVPSDYQGVYVLQERISRNKDRVNVERLGPTDIAEPEVTGGYILSIDRRDAGETGFRSALGHPEDPAIAGPQPWFNFIYPKERNILPAQKSYIMDYIDKMEAALYGPQFRDPIEGYRSRLDVDSFINHHILVTFTKDPDALRLSTFMNKPRNGKLRMGPIWDFDRTMGNDADGRSANPEGWDPPNETAQFFLYDWWGRLFQDPDFFQAWIDRWQSLREGEMRNDRLLALVDNLASQVEATQGRNFERWPENSPNGGPFSNLPGWEGEVDHLKGWLQRRAEWIDSQFPAKPQLNPASGTINPGALLTMSSPGNQVYYTLNGSDPRTPGGAVAGSAQAYEGGVRRLVWVGTDSTVRARVPDIGDAALGIGWTAPDFNPEGWLTGTGGVGYDGSPDYRPHYNLDLNTEMNGVNTSVYLRYDFELDSTGDIESLALRMKYDDGFVAYLNGERVASAQFGSSDPEWNSSALGQNSDTRAVVFETFDLSHRIDLLQAGQNTLAIQGLNVNTTSSDFLIAPELEAGLSLAESAISLTQSTVITARAFNGKDWSSPVRHIYAAGRGVSNSNLVISELHYHPAPPSPAELDAGITNDDAFEFLELLNIGSFVLDLTGVRFDDGIQLEFVPDETGAPSLSPGERLVLASDLKAFRFRYADQLNQIRLGGEYVGNLANNGERILLSAIDGTIVQDFSYDDDLPWPTDADGTGPSLVLRNPTSAPDPSNPANWMSGKPNGGTPGQGESGGFIGDPLADLDGNGIEDILDYAFGTDLNPGIPNGRIYPIASLESVLVEGKPTDFLTVKFPRNLSATQVTFALQTSNDLVNWSEASAIFEYIPGTDQGNGTAIDIHRTLQSVESDPALFVRLVVRY